jgi:chromosome segregation ATPase
MDRAATVAKLANLENKENALKNQAASLAKREEQEAKDEAALNADLAAQAERVARVEAEFARHDAEVTAHNSRCHGTFEDAVFVNRCNQRKADLDAWGAALTGRIEAVNKAADVLDERDEDLVRRKADTKAQIAANTTALAQVAEEMAVLRKEVRRLKFAENFLDDPRARVEAGRHCGSIPDWNIEAIKDCADKVFGE